MRFLDSLVGVAIPLLIFYFLFWLPFRRVRAARSWQKTPCVIVATGFVEDRTESLSYNMVVMYEYQFAGQRYLADRYNFLPGTESIGYWRKRRLTRRLGAGTATVCYVNPDDPADAVLDRGLPGVSGFIGLFAISCLFAAFFFAGH